MLRYFHRLAASVAKVIDCTIFSIVNFPMAEARLRRMAEAKLTRSRIQAILGEELSDDLPAGEHMLSWTEADVRRYCQEGGFWSPASWADRARRALAKPPAAAKPDAAPASRVRAVDAAGRALAVARPARGVCDAVSKEAHTKEEPRKVPPLTKESLTEALSRGPRCEHSEMDSQGRVLMHLHTPDPAEPWGPAPLDTVQPGRGKPVGNAKARSHGPRARSSSSKPASV